MKITKKIFIHFFCFLLLFFSLFSVVCDYLILSSFIAIVIECLLFKTGKTSKKIVLSFLSVFIINLIFFALILIHFRNQESQMDNVKINLANKNLKRIYNSYKENNNYLSLLIELQKENENTILKDSCLLIPENYKHYVQKNDNQLLALYYFRNKYKSRTIFIFLLNNGDIKEVIHSE